MVVSLLPPPPHAGPHPYRCTPALPLSRLSCQTGRGITPFKVDPYYDVQYGNTTNTFCISIGATTPLDPKVGAAGDEVVDGYYRRCRRTTAGNERRRSVHQFACFGNVTHRTVASAK